MTELERFRQYLSSSPEAAAAVDEIGASNNEDALDQIAAFAQDRGFGVTVDMLESGVAELFTGALRAPPVPPPDKDPDASAGTWVTVSTGGGKVSVFALVPAFVRWLLGRLGFLG